MPSEATLNKYSNELLAFYIKLWETKYRRRPEINRFKQRWGFKGMYEDLGIEQSKKVIEYYLNSNRMGHPVDYLLYNYEVINKRLMEKEKDAEERRLLILETKKKVEEREARGNN